MRGTSKVFALVIALVALGCAMSATAFAAGSGGGAKPKAKSTFRIINATQQNVLKRGVQIKLTVKVRKPKHRKTLRKPVTVKIKGASSTFDQPSYKTLTKPKTLKLRKTAKRTVALKLTSAGKTSIRSCEGRTLRVQIGKVKKTIKLKRTGACAPQEIDLSQAADCDFIGQQSGSMCLLPYPDDYYTVDDSSTPTGKRLNLHTAGMPANVNGVHVDATPYSASDGWSQGTSILLRVPGLDNPTALANTNPAGLANPSTYTESAQPVVVIDTTTGQRWPVWTEIDSNAETADDTLLEIHPLVNFDAKHRYVVALRNLKDAAGNTIAAPEGFRYYRDDLPSSHSEINSRRDHFDGIFNTLKTAGVKRADLYLAWDFTVASDENNSQRLLTMRNKAFATLNDTTMADGQVQGTAPSFTITSSVENPTPGQIERRVQGTFQVPCYMTPSCASGGTLNLGSDGLPAQNGTYTANFDCIIPVAAFSAPGRISLYGHGLFGDASEVNSGPQRSLAQGHNFVTCATDEIGMAEEDQITEALPALLDMSKFPALPDRSQQGVVNELFLGRLMDNAGGFASVKGFHRNTPADLTDANAAIAPNDGANLTTIDTSKLYYNGNSQGGILGGTFTAVSPDVTRSSLGVPGMNYSVLLPRSVDFDKFNNFFKPSYPSQASRTLSLTIVQSLWDRSDPNGYAHRMTTDPLPNTPPHKVLMNVALGDHQVSNWTANTEARTIGAKIHTPVVYDGRWPGVDYQFGLDPITSYPYDGSAIVYWDGGPLSSPNGTDVSPITNIPNRTGSDPHSYPRNTAAEQQMVSDFLRPDGSSNISDTCSGGPCYSNGFTGP